MSKQEIRPTLKNPRHEAFAQAVVRGMSASAIVDGLIRKRRRTIDDQVAVKKQQMESLLRKPEILRDDMGRFEQRGTGLRKSAKISRDQTQIIEKKTVEITGPFKPGQSGNLPHTLAADAESSGGVKVVFERHIVHPGGHREIEGVTPKLLPPASHSLPSDAVVDVSPSDIKDLDA